MTLGIVIDRSPKERLKKKADKQGPYNFPGEEREERNILEKDIENLVANYPNEFFPNENLKLISQQYPIEIRQGKTRGRFICLISINMNTCTSLIIR